MFHPSTITRTAADMRPASLVSITAEHLRHLNVVDHEDLATVDLSDFQAARRTAQRLKADAIRMHSAAAVMHTCANMILEMPPAEHDALVRQLGDDPELCWMFT